MSRDANGTYTAPSNSWNPAISGTQLNSDDWVVTQQDYETALTESNFTAATSAVDGQIALADGTGGRKIKWSSLTEGDIPATSSDITWTGNHTFNGTGTTTFNQAVTFATETTTVSGTAFNVSALSTFTGVLNANAALNAATTLQVTGTATFNGPVTAINATGPVTFGDTLGVTGITTLGTANITACNATDLTVTNVPTFSAGIGTLTELQVGAGAGAPSAGSVTIENDLTVGGISSFKSVGSDDLTAGNDITSTTGNITASSGTITGASFASQTATDVADSTTAVFPVPNTNGVVCVVRSDSAGSDEYYHGGYDAGGVDEVETTPNNAEYRGPIMGGDTGTNADVVSNMVVSISGANLVVANNSGTTADYRVTFF